LAGTNKPDIIFSKVDCSLTVLPGKVPAEFYAIVTKIRLDFPSKVGSRNKQITPIHNVAIKGIHADVHPAISDRYSAVNKHW